MEFIKKFFYKLRLKTFKTYYFKEYFKPPASPGILVLMDKNKEIIIVKRTVNLKKLFLDYMDDQRLIESCDVEFFSYKIIKDEYSRKLNEIQFKKHLNPVYGGL